MIFHKLIVIYPLISEIYHLYYALKFIISLFYIYKNQKNSLFFEFIYF